MPLREGVCPRGHPQRAARARQRPRRGRFALPLLVIALIAAAVYAALFWYPVRAAEELIVPASEGYGRAAAAYARAVEAFPSTLETGAIEATTTGVRDGASEAREVLSREQAELESRPPVSIPIIKDRPPLPLASRIRARMLDFYIGGLEMVSDLESIARYVAELAPTLPRLDDLLATVGNPATPADVDAVVAAARPIADQLVADVEALTPPVELSGMHESLKAVAERLRASLDELDQVAGQGAGPIIASLVGEIGRQLDSFRSSVAAAPQEARSAGLGSRLQELERQQERIAKGLAELRGGHGIPVTASRP